MTTPEERAINTPKDQVEMAEALVGKYVRFAGDTGEGGVPMKVLAATVDGMVEVERRVGQFAPHLFKVVIASRLEAKQLLAELVDFCDVQAAEWDGVGESQPMVELWNARARVLERAVEELEVGYGQEIAP